MFCGVLAGGSVFFLVRLVGFTLELFEGGIESGCILY